MLYYEAPRGKQQMIGSDDVGEIQWSTWTCVLGDSCTGIWPAYTDVTDVNTACRSRDNHVIATGDDFGLVKLFVYPSYVSCMYMYMYLYMTYMYFCRRSMPNANSM